MSFGFAASTPAGGGAELGSELPDVFTDEVGFKGVSGDANVRFLPSAWPDDALPAPTSSLLAVAHTKGLIVGAGPDALAISSNDAVRKAIEAPAGEDMEKTKAFQPHATIPLPARPTHIAFSPDDQHLILATENGASISIFDTTSLTQGNAQPGMQIPTNGVSLRALVPNPDHSSALVALVTVNGDLLIADVKTGTTIEGANGPVLKSGVSCVSWSNKGKQLVAGLADGTGYQMTPDGTKKDEIPRPPDLEGECHVSSVAWLENDVFFIVYTPNTLEDDMGMNPASSYYIITRRKQAPFLIQKLPEICSTMGFTLKRAPAYQFITRIRDYKPDLKDVLIVSSTVSTDVGLITRSDKPLANDERTKFHVGQFMTTEVSDDTKRASVPLKDSVDETSVIGLAPNLSATEPVSDPLPGSDISESSSPLPGLFLLNNDGILSSWWLLYSEAIRQNTPYSGLVSAGQVPQAQAQAQPAAPDAAPAGASKTFFAPPAPSHPSFGSSGFGQPTSGPATFGSPSPLGASTMGATTFAKTSFGSGSPAPAFGTTSTLAPITPSQPGVQFGQSGFGKPSLPSPPKNPFGASGASTGGGFSKFGSGGGFSSFAAATPGKSPFAQAGSGESPFTTAKSSEPPVSQPPPAGNPFGASQSTESPFATASSGQTPFGAAKSDDSPFSKPGPSAFGASKSSFGKPAFGASEPNESPFGKPAFGASKPTESPFGKPAFGESSFSKKSVSAFDKPKSETTSAFGAGPGGFQLKSNFKGDGSAVNDSPKTDKPSSGAFSFGGSFDEMVSTPKEGSSDSEDMDDESDEAPPTSNEPFSIFGGPKPTGTPPTSLFGSKKDSSKTTTSSETNKTSFSFGSLSSQNQVTSPLSAPSDKTETPKKDQLEAPLPPDPTSRATYAPGDTSASSNVSKSSVEDGPLPPDATKKTTSLKEPTDAPLPPDFMSKKKSAPQEDDAPLPPDFMRKPKESDPSASPEDAPLPPDFAPSKPKTEAAEETVPVPDEDSDADESNFSDSGEEITHEETKFPSPKPSVESSFGAPSEKSFTGGLFSGIAKPGHGKGPLPRQLFGEIPKQPLLPPPGPAAQSIHEPHRSPSPTRGGSRKEVMFSERPHSRKESTSALHSRKTSLTHLAQRDGHLRKASDIAREEQERAHAAAQRQALEEEELALSDDDEDERLRNELAQPIEPADTLDPFLPHQNYMGETAKPGIPGQIELLYRDSNSMVDTAGINARSVKAYLAYHQPAQESDDSKWDYILQSEHPNDILDVKLFFKDIENFDKMVATISRSLESQRVQGVDEKLQECRDLLTKQVITLRSQFAGIRKTLDAHTDIGAILEAPLSAEQSTLQLDLRTAFTDIQAKLADIEQAVSLLRAQIADVPRANGASGNRPTVETVIKTLNTMMTMTESKRTDVDVIESQMRRLGIESTTVASPSREGSPFTTPRKTAGRVPMTPGSRGSLDGSAYHTPESATRGLNFRASIMGSAKQSRLRSVEGAGEFDVAAEEATRWKTKSARRQHLVQNLKNAIEGKKTKVRGVDDL
ncbi:hypothetical protein PENANT_c016G01806 [Penicillium antarcticum]|uniref:Nucleoporin Nup159/Nup146 N-terminal domain-containing protein n=1 Tax=Penicillium antarcticum TaxID=416450 RepID=A0A1V6Q4C0_9EURO|nr:uncharacterized protein N7508_001288 [Penicillium antarcticum]KAJ5316780.1 hypothetical protein N7508_001288 [Penicillium antarcticum]OQD83586.1 hypothetical protein PENANT_c016G01806 [Penicillium antarcticum]